MVPNGASVVVTGAAGGIGGAIVDRLHADGYQVIGVDRAHPTREVEGVRYVVGDGTHPLTIAKAMEAGAADGSLIGLVNSVGFREYRDFREIDTGFLDKHFEANVVVPLLWMNAAATVWRQSEQDGSIVNLTSIMAHQVVPQNGAYAASKAALYSLSKSAALDLAPWRIRVNCVAPGPTDTVMLEPVKSDPVRLDATLKRIPLGRLGAGTDVANVVAFLISKKSEYVTGATVVVDGGFSLA